MLFSMSANPQGGNKNKEEGKAGTGNVTPLSSSSSSAPPPPPAPVDEGLVHSGEKDAVVRKSSVVAGAMKSVTTGVTTFVTSPIQSTKHGWKLVKEMAQHYYIGSKLLWQEIKLARAIVGRVLAGHGMTRRERIQLIRTTMDVFRVVPLTIFLVVPFMEFFLPVALKFWPNMLPSTFQDKLKKEEQMKKELKARLDIAAFMQETLQKMAEKKKKPASDGDDGACSATEIIEFIEKSRKGEGISNDQVIKMARFFEDELTLANVGRPQLVSMCKYMGLSPYGADAFLRFQLRTKLRAIKEDDQSISWEGIDSLYEWEIRDACQERGMRAVGLSNFAYKRQLQDWLDLSMQKSVPISLLVLSRAFSIANTSSPESDTDGIKSSISGLDEELLNEVVLAAARDEEENTVDMKMRRLESLEFQNELIEEEIQDREIRHAAKKGEQGASTSGEAPEGQTTTSAGGDGEVESSGTHATAAPPTSAEPKEVEVEKSVTEGELSLAELEALGDLVRDSSVEREKTKLQEIKATLEASSVDDKEMEEAKSVLKDIISSKLDGRSVDAKAEAVPSETFVETPLPADDVASREMGADATPGQVGKEANGEAVEVTANEPVEEVVEDKSLTRMKSVIEKMVDRLEQDIEKTESEVGSALKLLDLDRDGSISVQELKDTMYDVLKRHLDDTEAETIVAAIDKDGDGKISVDELLQWIEETKRKEKSGPEKDSKK